MGSKFQEKNGKWRRYSTISDTWATNWLTKESMIAHLQQRIRDDAEQKCDEIAETFPNGYFDMNTRMIHGPQS